MKSIIRTILLLQITSFNLVAFAEETKLNGADLTKKYCSECHGENGNSTIDSIPKIAGFSAILIFDIMDQFKNGGRKTINVKDKNNQITNMTKISKKLSEEEIETISLYLSEQEFIPEVQESNKKLAIQGKQVHEDLCNDCHADYGTSAEDDAPILAGQWKTYLIRQFKQLSNNERYMPKRMKRKFRKITEMDKQLLIEFYTNSKK